VRPGTTSVGLVVVYLAMLAGAVVSGRWGVMWTEHDWQTCAEVDVGAVHVLWFPKGATMAFAPSGVELIRHDDGWGWSGWRPRVDCGSAGKKYVCLPLWLIGLPLLVPVLVRRGQREILADTPCAACGYELFGNESGVCPECGTAISDGRRSACSEGS